MQNKVKNFWFLWDRVGILFILLIVGVVYGSLNINIVKPAQLITAVSRSAIPGIAAAGMMFAIVAGGFDLSVGSLLSLSSCIIAVRLMAGTNTYLAIATAFAAAIACGFINGIVITKLKIPAFVATLATQLAFAGIALVYSSKSIFISSTYNKNLVFFTAGKFLGIPMPVLLLAATYLITFFFYKMTGFGVKCRAIGSNETAARTTGIRADNTLILVFVVTAFTASVAAVLNTAQVSLGSPSLGSGFELDAITAVVLGGTALSGGKGNVFGTLTGAVLVTFVKMGLNIMGVSEAYQKVAVAVVLLFALTINGLKLITRREENYAAA